MTEVRANGLTVHFERAGRRDAPPLVLLHGRTDAGACWARVAGHLADRYDVLMPDARGHGQTAGPVAGTTAEVLADDAAAFVEAMAVGPAILYGHSMGAFTAMLIAARRPELVRAAVLEDPPLRDGPDPRDRDERAREAAIAGRPTRDELIRSARAQHPAWADDEIEPWADAQRRFDPDVLRITWPTAWREIVRDVRCPLLLIAGDPGGGLVTPHVASEVVELAARGRAIRIAGAGHSIHRDRFDETMAAVDAFLADVAAG